MLFALCASVNPRLGSVATMTVVVTVKIHDGVVLASDSATTMVDDRGQPVIVYNNANKLFNLYKGLPIGAITWGSGSIGHASISTLAKDFRRRLLYDPEWMINRDSYTMADVVTKAKRFFYDESYIPVVELTKATPVLGLRFAGYSATAELPEVYDLLLANECIGPTLIRTSDQNGLNWAGDYDAIQRLIIGHSQLLGNILKKTSLTPEQVAAVLAAARTMEAPVVAPAMPIQDAIELAEFLVRTQAEYSRFVISSRPAGVGGPIEIATITKHESFKWIKRKHFFQQDLNLGMRKEEERSS